jgi:hypothetical protein
VLVLHALHSQTHAYTHCMQYTHATFSNSYTAHAYDTVYTLELYALARCNSSRSAASMCVLTRKYRYAAVQNSDVLQQTTTLRKLIMKVEHLYIYKENDEAYNDVPSATWHSLSAAHGAILLYCYKSSKGYSKYRRVIALLLSAS